MEKQWEYIVRSGIYGLCVADALGVPGEGMSREDIQKDPFLEMIDSYGGFGGSRRAVGQMIAVWLYACWTVSL